jgi:molecular chaperone GrpE
MSKKPTIAELEQKIAELTDALLRERADAINVRRRAEDDKVKMASFYKAKVIRDLLPALDNLERALKHVPKDLAEHDYIKGVKNIARHFEQNLQSLGVEKIETVGQKFDPDLHEAIHMEEGDGDEEVVSEELQPGYKIGDEVIRHAIVKVKMEKK